MRLFLTCILRESDPTEESAERRSWICLASEGSPRFGARGSGSELSRASGLPTGVALGHPQSPGFVLF